VGNKTESAGGGGVGFCGLLAIAFIVLKLCGVIDWSWWWVVAPIWIPFALLAVFAVFCVAMWVLSKIL
jgi:hypothetical protein